MTTRPSTVASHFWRAAVVLSSAVVLLTGAPNARGETAGSFQLTATAADLPAYFPGYLGNGFVSTLTAPRGTEPTRAYLVAFMDYAEGDMSRPAAVPGWTEVDFNPGPPDSGYGWLNRVPLSDRHFDDYRQTLNLHDATLTTSYHFRDRDRDTAVEVVSLVSEADPHLAATRLTLQPNYDGVVQLSFALTLWARHAPRFALAEMSGPEMEEAVAAYGLSLLPSPPATPDREAVWYPGYTEIQGNDGDSRSLSLWLDGQAERGLPMAMAVTLALPEGGKPDSVTVHRDQYRLALDVNMKVERGQSYTFTKYVTISRSGWGGKAADDLALAKDARERGFDRMLSEHRAAWDALWQSDVVIEGDPKAQQVAHSELYYLLASSTAGTEWPLGACALTPGYANHAFWDSDTWIFPALLLLHPERARPLVDFRSRTLRPARDRAKQRGFQGAMYPWESDPENGTEQTPHSAYVLGESEIHVNADVAIAQWQYFLATQDREWLRKHGWPVISDVARFWASRATFDSEKQRYSIAHITSVAEPYTNIQNDTFTNVSAARALVIATTAANLLGEKPDPLWSQVARGLYIPVSADGRHHLPFDPTVSGPDKDFGGGPLALLFLPSLDFDMGPNLRRNDYDFAVRPTPVASVGNFSMGIAPRSVAADTIGKGDEAAAWFATNFTGGTLKPPFNVRTETASNNTGYFLTGSGAYIQNLVFGFSGLRIREAGLVQAYPAVLPANWSSMTLRNVWFRGKRMDIRIARDGAGSVHVTRTVH